MAQDSIREFAEITAQLIGVLDTTAYDATPYPWFCKDIFRKRDLQWAGYIGAFSQQKNALVFGINLEFIPAWRKVYPRIKDNFDHFSRFLGRHKNLEWHWMARPGVIAKNPGIRYLSPSKWTFQVDPDGWLAELGDILDQKKMWSKSIPMRPQIQIMRHIGLPIQLSDVPLITQNIQQTVIDLQPFVDLLGK